MQIGAKAIEAAFGGSRYRIVSAHTFHDAQAIIGILVSAFLGHEKDGSVTGVEEKKKKLG